MEHRQLTDEDRASIARGWRRSGLTQPAYAAAHSITDRTLRAWIARWAPSYPNADKPVRDVCERAIERLRALIADLDSHGDSPTAQSPPMPPPPGPASASAFPTRR